ncbi:hypothetical protein OAS47_04450 [Pelagibacteraceae bacterium]|nr:hypothetical protein [Pelagibacteraceae bacterium]
MRLFKIPAGKQIKIPSTKTIAIVIFGSLNLSEVKKNNRIKNDGTTVINRVVIMQNHNIVNELNTIKQIILLLYEIYV